MGAGARAALCTAITLSCLAGLMMAHNKPGSLLVLSPGGMTQSRLVV